LRFLPMNVIKTWRKTARKFKIGVLEEKFY
jgi:hypothetical protein